MQNKKTNTLLPIIRVCWYEAKGRKEKCFSLDDVNQQPSLAVPFAKMDSFLATIGKTRTDVNIYLIDKVNGEWRTDWELYEGGEILPHPWARTSARQVVA
jgi:hypothetical protein